MHSWLDVKSEIQAKTFVVDSMGAEKLLANTVNTHLHPHPSHAAAGTHNHIHEDNIYENEPNDKRWTHTKKNWKNPRKKENRKRNSKIEFRHSVNYCHIFNRHSLRAFPPMKMNGEGEKLWLAKMEFNFVYGIDQWSTQNKNVGDRTKWRERKKKN